jgi:hypothetical protein
MINLYEIVGYGSTFLVKATTAEIAKQKVHSWADGEGFSRVPLQVKMQVLATA